MTDIATAMRFERLLAAMESRHERERDRLDAKQAKEAREFFAAWQKEHGALWPDLARVA